MAYVCVVEFWWNGNLLFLYGLRVFDLMSKFLGGGGGGQITRK